MMKLIPPNCWQHVKGADNPADTVSRGIFPSELIKNYLRWEGPQWLWLSESHWRDQSPLLDKPEPHQERDEEPNLAITTVEEPSLLDRFSNYTRLKRVTAWMFRFVHNCVPNTSKRTPSNTLTTEELQSAEWYWIQIVQHEECEGVAMTLKAGISFCHDPATQVC